MADGGDNGPAKKKGTALVVYPAAVKNDVMVYELLIAKEAELKKELRSCRSHMRSIRHNFYSFMGEEDLGTIQGDNFSVHAKRKSSHQGFAEAWWVVPLKDFIAGTVGGFAGKVIEYPFDTIKVQMQASGDSSRGPLSCFREVWRKDGLKGLYKGLPLPLAGTMIETATLFTSMGQMRKFLVDNPNDKLTVAQTCIAGGGAGFMVSFVLTPIELVKCRMQVANAPYKGTWDCLSTSIRNEGAGVMYKGLVGTILREVPGTAAWFGAYETFVEAMTPPGKTRSDLPAATIIGAGGLGGMAYWLAFYPADTVKSLMQTGAEGCAQRPGENQIGAFSRIFKATYRKDGLPGLYRGLVPTLLRAMPANGAVFYMYETISEALKDVF